MLTTLALCFSAPLLSVTFGWIPSEGDPEADSYEYLVKLSDADLQALRAGKVESLTSELPTDIGPIDRVRFYLGEGEAPKRLTARDERSPRRIAEASRPQRHVVAKPVIPAWDEDASWASNEFDPSDDAVQQTVYQNPGAFDPRNLADGFQRGVQPLTDAGQQAGQYLQNQAQNLTNNTQAFLNQAGQNVENGLRNGLNSVDQTLRGGVPARNDVYGDRPNYGATSPDYSAQANPNTQGNVGGYDGQNANAAPPLREPANSPPYNSTQNPGYNWNQNQSSNNSSNLAESFAGGGVAAEPERPLTSIPRSPTATAPSRDFDAFAETNQYNSNQFNQPERRSSFSPTSDQYRSASPTAQDDRFAPLPEAPRSDTFDDRFPSPNPSGTNYSQSPPSGANPTNYQTRQPTGSDAEAELWARQFGSNANNTNETQSTTVASTNNGGSNDQWDMDRLLVVILTAATCFTLVAHVELRNKYRAALRGLPTGGSFFNPGPSS